MTNIIIGERCSGKTTRLILRSAREQIYILTSTKPRAQAIFNTARNMGLAIPFPVTLGEYLRGSKFRGSSIRQDGLLIDDVDDVIRELFYGIPIHEMTMTDYGNIERLDSLLDLGIPLSEYEDLKDSIRARLEDDFLDELYNLIMNHDPCLGNQRNQHVGDENPWFDGRVYETEKRGNL